MTRAQQRFATASAAILVQILLVTLFANSFLPGKPREVVREMFLSLRPILKPLTPAPPPPKGRLPRMIVPPAAIVPPLPNERMLGLIPAPPSALEGIGRSLFGCAPERYGQLTREEQLRCPPPGEGLARAAPDAHLLNPPRSHSRDEVLWQEAVAARNFMPNCFANTGETITGCMIRQTLAERQRAKQAMVEYDYKREQRNKPPPPPKPPWVGAVQPKRQAARP